MARREGGRGGGGGSEPISSAPSKERENVTARGIDRFNRLPGLRVAGKPRRLKPRPHVSDSKKHQSQALTRDDRWVSLWGTHHFSHHVSTESSIFDAFGALYYLDDQKATSLKRKLFVGFMFKLGATVVIDSCYQSVSKPLIRSPNMPFLFDCNKLKSNMMRWDIQPLFAVRDVC